MSRLWWRVALISVAVTTTVCAAEVGLVTSVSGKVMLQSETSAASALQSFIKVRDGDQLLVEGPARLQVVYFDGGREETWLGPETGTITVGKRESKLKQGKLQSSARTLPAILVKQLSKTPAGDGNVKAGMVRIRSLGSSVPPGSADAAEKHYAEMRSRASSDDRTPELYLLASYFEVRQFEKLNQLLSQLNEKEPGNAALGELTALYAKAVAEAQATAK